MPTDTHYHPLGPIPEVIEDHQPNDMPAARSMLAILSGILLLGGVVAAVLYYALGDRG